MLDAHQKPTGTRYTITVALLIVAFFFSPALLIVSRPLGYGSFSLALTCSVLCVALAWVVGKKYSELTIPSIATRYSRAK